MYLLHYSLQNIKVKDKLKDLSTLWRMIRWMTEHENIFIIDITHVVLVFFHSILSTFEK